MGWCDDVKSHNYNRLIKFPFNRSAEKLFLKKKIYDLILVINFNRKPTVKNKGSAIFLHLIEKNLNQPKDVLRSKKDFVKILPLITKS